MRVLGAVRLSNDTDTTTSPEGQREQIEAWAQRNGHTVTAWAEDTDVSARKVAPAKRPQLSKWLTNPQLGAWDILVCAKQDRLFRSVADIGAMTKWALEHGKSWASVAENTDLSTAAGRMFANQLATFGEFEADRIAERCREGADRLAARGRWRGGKTPYGYAPRCLCHGERRCPNAPHATGWTLTLDATQAGTARDMAKRAIGGASNGQVARWLNAESVSTPHGGYEWTPESVRTMLRAPSLAGWSVRNGKVVRDDDGNPVMITDVPVLDADAWASLQDALDSRKQHRGERVGGHMLLQVAYCRQCSKPKHDHEPGARCSARTCQIPLYGHMKQGSGRRNVYRCQRCGYSVVKEVLEAAVESGVMADIGDRPLPRKVIIPAISHTAELADVDRLISDIDAAFNSGDLPIAAYSRQMTTLEAKRDKLAALPQREAQVTYEPTGQTVREHWATLDSEGRGKLLRNWSWRIYADIRGIEQMTMWEYVDGTKGDYMAQVFCLNAA